VKSPSECAITLVPDIPVFGHFGPRRILTGGSGGVSMVSSVTVRFRVKVRFRDDAVSLTEATRSSQITLGRTC